MTCLSQHFLILSFLYSTSCHNRDTTKSLHCEVNAAKPQRHQRNPAPASIIQFICHIHGLHQRALQAHQQISFLVRSPLRSTFSHTTLSLKTRTFSHFSIVSLAGLKYIKGIPRNDGRRHLREYPRQWEKSEGGE